ncbi:Putative lipoprotein signal peptide [Minicystis rosea]|nr:Putative lipoprotein signal peptide [Minicystis rosea]
MLRQRRLLAAPLLTLALAGCGGGNETTAPDGGTPDGGSEVDAGMVDPSTFGVTDTGPFTCGHRVLEITYNPPAGQPARTIPVHVWYPSTSTDGEHSRYKGIFLDPNAWEDGALAPAAWKAGYPVLVHSHGHMGFAGNSYRLMCHFAMHGWLTVAPEHVGNTLTDTPDPRPLALYYERPLDMRAALGLIEKLPAEDPLAGKADFGHLGVSGHSFGTYTAWAQGGSTFDVDAIKAACAKGDPGSCDDAGYAVFGTDLSEKRAKAIIPMAGGQHEFFGTSGLDATKVPALLMTGSLDQVGADMLFANISGVDFTWADVEGGCHQLYGLGNSVKGDAACTALDDEEGFGIVNPYILAFARYHVLGERGEEVKGLVEGTKGISPKMHVQHKGP